MRWMERLCSSGGPRNVYRMLRADGGWTWILDRTNVVERNAAGEAVRMVGIHIEIGESEAAILSAENKADSPHRQGARR
ncbi:MAG: PAS domain-containing protein, partial [Synergistota bacterium]|nr:PAS domain-containing protein [Synergistota bacterium]